MDEESVCKKVWEHTQEKPYQDELRCVGSRNSGSAGVMEAFEVGDAVLLAWPRKVKKLVVTWTGPWRVVVRWKDVYTGEDI